MLSAGLAAAAGELALRAFDPLHLSYYREIETIFREGIQSLSGDPLGYQWRPGYQRRFRRYTVRINHAGIRADQEYTEKSPGRSRLVCLGDSVTFGLGVEREQAYPAQLGLALDAEAINLGVPGYNTRQSLETWRRRGRALAPDVVVLFLVVNDLESDDYPDHRLAADPPQGVRTLRQALPVTADLAAFLCLTRAEGTLLEHAPSWEQHKRDFRSLVEEVRQQGAGLVTITEPTLDRSPRYQAAAGSLAALAAGLGVENLDLNTVFPERDLSRYRLGKADPHGTPAAYARMVEALAPRVRARLSPTAPGLLHYRRR